MYDMKHLSKLKKLGELAPDAWKGFVAFDEAAFKEGGDPAEVQGTDGGRGGADDAVPVLHRNPREEGKEGRRDRDRS